MKTREERRRRRCLICQGALGAFLVVILPIMTPGLVEWMLGLA